MNAFLKSGILSSDNAEKMQQVVASFQPYFILSCNEKQQSKAVAGIVINDNGLAKQSLYSRGIVGKSPYDDGEAKYGEQSSCKILALELQNTETCSQFCLL